MTPMSAAIHRERRAKTVFFVGALALLLVTLLFVQNLLVSFLLAFVTYYLLTPAVDFFERRGLSRLTATTIPFLFLTVVMVIVGVWISPLLIDQIKSLQANAPQYMESLSNMLTKLEVRIEEISSLVGASGFHGKLQPKLMAWMTANMQEIPNILSQSLTILLLSPFLAFFLLLDGRDFIRGLLNLVPNNLFELTLDLSHQISTQIGGFIRARLVESIVVGLLVWIGLLIFNFPYALLLALCAGLLNVIPYLGPLLGAAPAFIIALVNGSDVSDILILFAIYGTAQIVDAAILVPFLVARIVNLHPVTVVLAVIIGSQMMGIIGMIICIPLVSALKVTLNAVYRHLTNFRIES